MSNYDEIDYAFTDFVRRYEDVLRCEEGPFDALDARLRAFTDAAIQLAAIGLQQAQELQDNAARTPKEGHTVTGVM